MKNRFLNLSPNYTFENNIKESKYDFLDDMISENCGTLYEAELIISENDDLMCTSNVEVSLVEAMYKQIGTLKVLTERNNIKKNKNIIKRCKKISESTKSAIAHTVKSYIESANSIYENDKNMYEKYFNALNLEGALDNFIGISHTIIPSELSKSIIESTIDISGIESLVENIDMENIEEDINHISRILEMIFKDNYNKSEIVCDIVEEVYKPTDKEIFSYINVMESDTYGIDFVVSNAKTLLESINIITENIVNNIEKANDKEAYQLYKLESSLCKTVLDGFKRFKNLTIRENAALRKILILSGKHAVKNSNNINESKRQQELVELSISEASDMYVFDKFTSDEYYS